MKNLLDDAMQVAKGAAPAFTRDEYEDAMLEIAETEARGGESSAVTFSRLISKGDQRMMALYKAARRAATVAEPSREEIAKARSAKDLIFALMEKIVRNEKRADETEAQAFARLAREDPEMRSSYALYRTLP